MQTVELDLLTVFERLGMPQIVFILTKVSRTYSKTSATIRLAEKGCLDPSMAMLWSNITKLEIPCLCPKLRPSFNFIIQATVGVRIDVFIYGAEMPSMSQYDSIGV